ncbi:RdgB/HAM1 family non-canonical purine NTP pyrophosphatase [Thiomicrorhabdus sp. 6S3-12]|uniref:RdgB/HAM1 family non-canonical purine NTP pyrophosphatase n=1 Tax=Thiomicrorhabdus sp. 6S3-12 TaxID=2819681 RepID=UPI001AAD0323|nr:RdgB/HAM1 family non-canonical purine NTP pyrophosphatase [Thiomicrorhabdus sp. 6S3-12]MBO1923336.1 RdgB/HAM1 family non-canonical purine NTP pyrophosphatase [Thiomicrorhabdus sp. 6S3-12]
MQKIVLASGNAGKLKEMSDILAPYGWEVHAQSEFFSEEAEETGLSFIENAILKARFAAQKTGLPAIADDSGIEVHALKGRPGIYSARYSADEVAQVSDESNLQKLLKALAGVPEGARQASYYCAMVYVEHAEDPTPIVGLGRWYGEILHAKRGDGGFGYDPIFWVDELGKSAAELPKEQKNQISHRAQALNALLMQLRRGA